MGGVLFTIEEGATVWRQQLTFLILYAACFTSFLRSIIRGFINKPGGSPIIPGTLFGSYRDEAPHVIFRLDDFPFVLLVSVTGDYFQDHLGNFCRKYIRTEKWNTLAEFVTISLAILTLRFWLPYGAGKCIHDHNIHYTQGDENEFPNTPNSIPFNCEDHYTNDLGILF